MNFTERFKHTVPQSCQVSPSGTYIANIYQNRVVVRNAETCKLVRQWTAADPLRELHWSPDSELLLSVTSKTELVQVWCLDDEKWTASIDDSIAGVSRVAWSPDSRHVLCFSDLQVIIVISLKS
jgi:WD40 repeat protein